MYTFTRLLSSKELLIRQAPTLLVSLTFAELFYRFGSFALEAVAFLATWFVLDVALAQVTRLIESRKEK